MTDAEYRAARKLLTATRSCSVSFDERYAKPMTKRTATWIEKKKQLGVEAAALAEAVFARELGLRRFMVIQVLRHDGYYKQLQVLSMSFEDRFNSGRPDWWSLEGRILRKDGSLGENGEGTGFDRASIHRRKLDGTWVPLIPKQPIEVEIETRT